MTDTSPAAGKPSTEMSLLEAAKFYRELFCDKAIYAIAETSDVVYKLSQDRHTARIVRSAYQINGGVVCSCPALIDRCRHIQIIRGEWDWAKCKSIPEFRLDALVRSVLALHGVEVPEADSDMFADYIFADISVPVIVPGVRALVGRARDSLDRIFGLRISFLVGVGK